MAARATSEADGSASIGQLVASIKDDLTGLVRDEIELAKAELKQDAKEAGLGGALIAVALFLGLLATILGSFALVYGVHALGLGLGWSFLVVAGAYVLVALLLLLTARSRFGRISKVERTKTTAREAARALKRSPNST
ncbi:phage holin family protein [Jiangella alkaliphila]|uniref:Putative Holin-X, holin superfamily III n=1 Tax=Jiangella alkaliphila TaxID=419479 RepID=A0A1H2GSY3_9ACTN|nr:phage holin family protein [Jiangella alkaliphila]SDU22763.1 Putative Holin-X, holin superfamily III [Jiangella alkaliphila]